MNLVLDFLINSLIVLAVWLPLWRLGFGFQRRIQKAILPQLEPLTPPERSRMLDALQKKLKEWQFFMPYVILAISFSLAVTTSDALYQPSAVKRWLIIAVVSMPGAILAQTVQSQQTKELARWVSETAHSI